MINNEAKYLEIFSDECKNSWGKIAGKKRIPT
jgi:hypothetical protein